MPTPRLSRPRENRSRLSVVLASTPIGWIGRITMFDRRRTRVVTAAAAVSDTHQS
jgi:hypothetical protein